MKRKNASAIALAGAALLTLPACGSGSSGPPETPEESGKQFVEAVGEGKYADACALMIDADALDAPIGADPAKVKECASQTLPEWAESEGGEEHFREIAGVEPSVSEKSGDRAELMFGEYRLGQSMKAIEGRWYVVICPGCTF